MNPAVPPPGGFILFSSLFSSDEAQIESLPPRPFPGWFGSSESAVVYDERTGGGDGVVKGRRSLLSRAGQTDQRISLPPPPLPLPPRLVRTKSPLLPSSSSSSLLQET